MISSTTLNATDSPLLRLPAELRNLIFAHVYIGTRYSLDVEGFLGSWNLGALDWDQSVIGLSLVCRQTHAETSLLPYELGMFDLFTGWQCKLDGLWRLQGFLEKRTPRQIDAMASLKFTQWSVTLNGYWHQTRTAAYWVAKLEDPSVSFYGGFSIEAMTQAVDISSLGPSD